MKKSIKFVLLVISFLGFMQISHAADFSVTDIQKYDMGKFSINRYQIGAASNKTFAYCLSPKKYNYTYYNKKSVINPKRTEYELALVVAYTYLINNGAIDETDESHVDAQDGGVISTTLRLISEYYGKLSHIGNLGNDHIEPYLISDYSKLVPKHEDYYKSGKAATALSIFKKAINKVKSTTGKTARQKFQNLQKNNVLWNKAKATFQYSDYTVDASKSTTNFNRAEFVLKLKYDKYYKMIDTINWKEFRSTNSDKAKRINSDTPICNCKTGSESCKCRAYVSKTVNSFEIKGNITTNRNTIDRMETIEPTANVDTFQTLIIVDSSPTTLEPITTIKVTGEPNPVCQIKDGVYYGPDGDVVTADNIDYWREECVKQCTIYNATNQTYYCKNDNPDLDGAICSYGEYRKQCDPISCEKEKDPVNPNKYIYFGPEGGQVSQSDFQYLCVKRCREIEGTYYCADNAAHDPDENGTICSYDDYYHQCIYCGKYEDFCTKNPTGVASDGTNCSTYWLNCPNCNGSVSIPNTCIGFDTDSQIKGTISDINISNTSCNHSVRPVKGCVIGGQDMANNSFQLVDQLKDNKICKAYCYEDYSFSLPTAKHSNSGGYFNLQMSVTGTRHCYLASNNMLHNRNNSTSSYVSFDFSSYKRIIDDDVKYINDKSNELGDTQENLNKDQNSLLNKKNSLKISENNLESAKSSYKNNNYKYHYDIDEYHGKDLKYDDAKKIIGNTIIDRYHTGKSYTELLEAYQKQIDSYTAAKEKYKENYIDRNRLTQINNQCRNELSNQRSRCVDIFDNLTKVYDALNEYDTNETIMTNLQDDHDKCREMEDICENIETSYNSALKSVLTNTSRDKDRKEELLDRLKSAINTRYECILYNV